MKTSQNKKRFTGDDYQEKGFILGWFFFDKLLKAFYESRTAAGVYQATK